MLQWRDQMHTALQVIVIRTTEEAVLMQLDKQDPNYDTFGDEEFWIPKSQIDNIDDAENAEDELSSVELDIKDWILMKVGIL